MSDPAVQFVEPYLPESAEDMLDLLMAAQPSPPIPDGFLWFTDPRDPDGDDLRCLVRDGRRVGPALRPEVDVKPIYRTPEPMTDYDDHGLIRFKRTFPDVLDGIEVTWPGGRTITVRFPKPDRPVRIPSEPDPPRRRGRVGQWFHDRTKP